MHRWIFHRSRRTLLATLWWRSSIQVSRCHWRGSRKLKSKELDREELVIELRGIQHSVYVCVKNIFSVISNLVCFSHFNHLVHPFPYSQWLLGNAEDHLRFPETTWNGVIGSLQDPHRLSQRWYAHHKRGERLRVKMKSSAVGRR